MNALKSLWAEQYRVGINPERPINDLTLRQLRRQVISRTNAIRTVNFTDRASNTIGDGIVSFKDLKTFFLWYFPQGTYESLRNWTMFILSFYGLLRGEDIRSAELADMMKIDLLRQDFFQQNDTTPMLMITLDSGKTNQNGLKQLAAMLRAKDVEYCPIVALGYFFFYRFNIAMEPLPNVSNNADWHGIKLAPKSRHAPRCQVSYEVQRKSISDALRAANIHSKWKTHIGRHGGATIARLTGLTYDDIRALGRWNQGAMENHYIPSIPLEAMIALAGFTRNESYFVRRADVPVPIELSSAMFPGLDDLERSIHPGQTEAVGSKRFVSLLRWLSETIVQDVAILQNRFPDHPVHRHQVFSTPAFLEYKGRLIDFVQREITPPHVRLLDTMPHLAEHLHRIESRVVTSETTNGSVLRNSELAVEKITEVVRILRGLTDAVSQVIGRWLPMVPSPDMAIVAQTLANLSVPPEPIISANDIGTNAEYRMPGLASLKTVSNLFREYDFGLSNGPAIKRLLSEENQSWRREEADRQAFCRRNHFYTSVKKAILEFKLTKAKIITCFDKYIAAKESVWRSFAPK
jgi:hypothetical protein